MSSGTDAGAGKATRRSLCEALLVYAEPLAAGAHVVVVGASDGALVGRLLEFGARSVYVLDPEPERAASVARKAPRGVTVRTLGTELDVRDGAFDLALISDVSIFGDAREAIALLRRAVDARGAIVAMGRARIEDEPQDAELPFGSELRPASLTYAELYDVFANEFEDVSLVGAVPFEGVVFAALGTEDEAPPVSVDTRLASPEAPRVFVVVAQRAVERRYPRPSLDPYAIVQLPADEHLSHEHALALEANVATATLNGELLAAEVAELKKTLAASEQRTAQASKHLERTAAERDAALTRAMEFEAVLAASQQTMGTLERRLVEAERTRHEGQEQLAALSAELERKSAKPEAPLAELEQLAEETTSLEARLAERAQKIAELEQELLRREHLVKELVASLDGLALEVAQREGELTARAWRIHELEGEREGGRPAAPQVLYANVGAASEASGG